MHALTAPPPITPADRLGMTLFIAVVAHAIVILGVSFVHEDRSTERVDTLDIVLVQHRSERQPEDADFLAQANQDGGGESAEPERPSTPLPAPFTAPEPEVASAAPPLPEAETLHMSPPAPAAPPRPEKAPAKPVEQAAEAPPPAPAPRPVVAARAPAKDRVVQAETRAPKPEAVPRLSASTLERAEPAPRERPAERAPEPSPAKPAPASAPAAPAKPTRTLSAAALINRSLAMASLDAQIDAKLRAYAKRPRRKWITARTREHKYAAYMEAWRAKVERIGNLNYPDEARRRRLSGNLLLDVALNADGSINEIVLRRSSGKRVLDDAARRIVKLSAPFARFPPGIARETDILHIQRTWRFLSSNRFSGG